MSRAVSSPGRHMPTVALAIGALLLAVGILGSQAVGGAIFRGLWPAGVGCLFVGLLQVWLARQVRADEPPVSVELPALAQVALDSPIPMLLLDNAQKVMGCNPAFVRETGYRLEDLKGWRPQERLRSPLADPLSTERWNAVADAWSDTSNELLVRYGNGQDRWVSVRLTAQQSQSGELCGFVMTLNDADEKVREREVRWHGSRLNEAVMKTLETYLIMAKTDAQGRITSVNSRFEKISGYDASELIGRTFDVVGSGWHSASFWESMWERIVSGHSWRGEVCNRGKHGRLYWVQTLIAPCVGADGRIEGYVAIQSDISDHRQAQIELNKSQALLTRTSELAGVGGWYAMLDSGSLTMTSECRALLGVEEGEICSIDDIWLCFEAGARHVAREQLTELTRGFRSEVDFVAPVRFSTHAKARWVRLVANVVESESGAVDRLPGRIIGAVQNHTQQVLAQQRTIEDQRILHSAMDAVGEAFALYDQNDRLLYFNDDYATWLPERKEPLEGISHEEVLQFIAHRGDFKEAVGREAEWVQEILRAPRETAPDRVRQREDGRWIRFIDRVTTDGHRVVFRYDVTELQNALIRADAAALSKGQFLANMSHEIRTPINAITGLLQMLAYTRLEAEQAVMLDKAQTATRSLLEILNDILDYSKIEANMMALHALPFRIADLHREVEVILGGALGEKALPLRFDVDSSLPPVVVGDVVRLKQVLINLGGNAIKFTSHGHVALRWTLRSQVSGRVRIRFEVEDTGIGIAPEQQARIFDSFSQAESSTSRRFGGSGLGLTISQRLVGLMGGQIELVSAPGVGSTFAFEIDLEEGALSDVPETVDALSSPVGERLRGVHLLLAEDNPLNQEVAMSMLQREGAVVTLAGDGQEAVDILRAHSEDFDLVLMDMQMPLLDGLLATEKIRDELRLHHLPVLAMTANAMESDRERCLQAGMNAHIAKPFDIDRVVALIRQFVGTGSADEAGSRQGECQEPLERALGLREDAACLRRLGGNQALLAQLRERFLATAEGQLKNAQACAARGEWDKAADAMHQLKGSAATVGADHLARDCSDAEARLRGTTGSGGPGSGHTLLWSLESLLRETREAFGEGMASVLNSIDAASHAADDALPESGRSCVDGLRALKPLLESADMAAIDHFEQWQATCPQSESSRFASLGALMDAMDLPAAAQECARLLAEPTLSD